MWQVYTRPTSASDFSFVSTVIIHGFKLDSARNFNNMSFGKWKIKVTDNKSKTELPKRVTSFGLVRQILVRELVRVLARFSFLTGTHC
jgi:hypothetical protein